MQTILTSFDPVCQGKSQDFPHGTLSIQLRTGVSSKTIESPHFLLARKYDVFLPFEHLNEMLLQVTSHTVRFITINAGRHANDLH